MPFYSAEGAFRSYETACICMSVRTHPAALLVRYMQGDFFGKVWEFRAQHVLGSVQDDGASLAGGNAAHDQHMLDFIKTGIIGDGVPEIHTDGLKDLLCALVPLRKGILHHLQLFRGRK